MSELRPIPGHPGYCVTNDGRVMGPVGWLTATLCGNGYYRYKTSHGQLYMHTAVLLAWVGPRPRGMQACHGDGDKANNRVSNLRWDTPAGNSTDRALHGTSKGARNGNARLSASDVREIRCLASDGQLTQHMIAEVYGVSASHVSRIVGGGRWT